MAKRARRPVFVIALAVGLVFVLAACRVVADPLENIGTLGGDWAAAYAVNDNGVIAGASSRPSEPLGEAMLYDPSTGVMTGLGQLYPGASTSAADVNNLDVAVGSARVFVSQIEFERAFVTGPSVPMKDITDELGDWHDSAAVAVNDAGVVVGWAVRYLAPFDIRIVVASLNFAYDIESATVTPMPIGAADINDAGVVVGSSGGHAASYDLATGVVTDLGTLGGSSSHALAVNDSGVVVGQSQTANGQFHAFRYDPAVGAMEDLGTLGGTSSIATGINDLGDIVGESTTSTEAQHPFHVWSVDRRMIDIGTIDDVDSLTATDINNSHVVVGFTRVTHTIGWRTTIRFLPHEAF
jgi:probable HAF family extracellular repeat protein